MDEKNQLNAWTVGAVLIIALIVFLIIWVWGSIGHENTENLVNAPAPTNTGAVIKAVDQAKLAADYKTASDKIFADYLSAVTADASSIAAQSNAAKDKLLALTLPAEYKDRHLSEVILLGQIAASAQSGKAADVQAKLEQLKAIINK